MSRRSLSALHWAILPNLSDNVSRVVATMGEDDDSSLSSDPDDSPPPPEGEPTLFLPLSFLIRVKSTYTKKKLSLLLFINFDFFFTGSPPFSLPFLIGFTVGLTPVISMTSPVRQRGLGGGGCLLGSVGRSLPPAVPGFAAIF